MRESKRTGTEAARIVVAEDKVAKLKAINWPEYLSLGEWELNVRWGLSLRVEVKEIPRSSQ